MDTNVHPRPPVLIRPIGPDDGPRLRASHAALSPESRYRRFLSAKPELTLSDTRYLVEIDGIDHFALVATLPGQPGEPIVAVARYIRVPDHPDVGELAIVVADALQHQGLGHELVGELARAATERGIHRFRATMLSENVAIRRLLERLAAGPVDYHRLGELLEIEFDLPAAEPERVAA